MSDTKPVHGAEHNPENDEADIYAAEQSDEAAIASGEEEQIPSPAEVIEKLNAENTELKDKLMRLAADMENLRRRTARDIADAKAYAVSSFARDMLSVADNLGRALSAVPKAPAGAEDARLQSLTEGVEMTERAMIAALQNHGVRKIETLGQKFDPHLHQAMFETEDKSVPHNSVNQELQPGYIIGDRVLRAAQVGIAKGGEKAAAEPKTEVDN
ncbi:nucleotide exchange factor GrpE [Candidatus Tokpelaia sp.]|uniref:nucleotide exchange factor GrpE n=1 Tax=Candidatus Tokpelaia sp. TaxID=2233777 RepID=UPI00123C39D2|nr:nucleotide exchange factor GrpE [Candidatus Tokpelaia sp.]KAA6405594.1 nucleotide exchange factor GrpE [Candidatus Tokpelaia sp.]